MQLQHRQLTAQIALFPFHLAFIGTHQCCYVCLSFIVLFVRCCQDARHMVSICYSGTDCLTDFHMICVGVSYDFHCMFIGFPQDFHMISIGVPYDVHRITIRCPQNLQRISIGGPQDLHWISVWFPQDVLGMSMGCPKDFHSISIGFP